MPEESVDGGAVAQKPDSGNSYHRMPDDGADGCDCCNYIRCLLFPFYILRYFFYQFFFCLFPAEPIITKPTSPQDTKGDLEAIRVFTMNTWCMPFFCDTMGRSALMYKCFFEKYDLVCLQEQFADDAVYTTLKHAKEKFWTVHNAGPSRLLSISSGLLMLSKHPILEAKFEVYRDLVGAERWSRKGFLYVKLQVGKDTVHVVNTHAQADPDEAPCWLCVCNGMAKAVKARQGNAEQIVKFVKKNVPENEILLITGDFNVPGETEEYKNLKGIMNNNNMVDVFREKFPNDPGLTWEDTRLDYIFVRDTELGQVTSCKIVDREKLTDHHGVEMKYHLAKKTSAL